MSPFPGEVAKIGSGSSRALRTSANMRIVGCRLPVASPTPQSRRRLSSVLEEQVSPGADALRADEGQVKEEYEIHSRLLLGYS